MSPRWVQTAAFDYAPDENGLWRGHWIGRARNRRGKIRGLSFASRRCGRVWGFWIGRDC